MISNSVQMLTHGLKVTDFMPTDSNEEVDIVIRFDKAFRTLDELDKIFIEGKNGPVSLSSFIKRNAKKKLVISQDTIYKGPKLLNLMS